MIRTFEGIWIDDIITLWNEALPEHPTNRDHFMKNVLLDMNFDAEGFLIAEQNGVLCGFAQAIVRRYPVDVDAPDTEEKGYLNLLVIRDRGEVENGLGEELITAAESYLFAHDVKKILVSGYTPNYIYPGINTRYTEYQRLYERLGYREQKRNFAIRAELTGLEEASEIERLKEKRETEGFIFTSLKDQYLPSLLESAVPGWRHRHRRLLNETLDRERFRLIIKKERVIGSAVFGDPYSNMERFGPFGVNEEYRGLGLGKILLYDTLMTMKKRGLTYAWAQSTPVSGAAFELYRKLGFRITDEFIVYCKKLE